MDNYVALSKRDLELQITLNEMYVMHGLLEKHSAFLDFTQIKKELVDAFLVLLDEGL
jgi:hypothetical protein